jgi:hypothetical protein
VVATLELHDVLALGIGAGQADGGHGGFGAGIYKAHLLHVRKCREHHFGQVGFARGRCAEAGAIARGVDDCVDDEQGQRDQESAGPMIQHSQYSSFSSASKICEPLPRTMNRGSPPTEPESTHRRVHSTGDEIFGALL